MSIIVIDVNNMNTNQDSKEEKKVEEVPVTVQGSECLKRLVPPHDIKSRKVLEGDLDYVAKEAKVLYDICMTGAWAMHHSQIEADDPMDFYVTRDMKIVINPIITKHSNYTVKHQEGCVSFTNEPWREVDRWQKCEIEYVSIMVDPNNKDKFKLSSKFEDSLSGMDAFVAQHETDHGRAKFIYKIKEEK